MRHPGWRLGGGTCRAPCERIVAPTTRRSSSVQRSSNAEDEPQIGATSGSVSRWGAKPGVLAHNDDELSQYSSTNWWLGTELNRFTNLFLRKFAHSRTIASRTRLNYCTTFHYAVSPSTDSFTDIGPKPCTTAGLTTCSCQPVPRAFLPHQLCSYAQHKLICCRLGIRSSNDCSASDCGCSALAAPCRRPLRHSLQVRKQDPALAGA
jgi:hypothetical protein